MPVACLLLSACGGGGEAADKGEEAQARPTEVGYVVVRTGEVPLVRELPGRVAAFAQSEVRPQVSGVVKRRFFTEGAIVRAGQPLYQIDPSLYRAAVNEAEANLRSARATAEAAGVRADRLRPLAEMEAVAAQDYTDAQATARQAQASIGQTGAQLETARINLRFTTVPAPITGRIGRTLVTEGALVTTNQVDPLAVIQRLDPVYVDIQQSSAELLALRRSLATEGVVPASATVRLTLEDGSQYEGAGTVQFAETIVDPNTGTVTLRARFSNPDGILLPGMFVRATFAQAINTQALLVPQAGVSRDPRGRATVWVVGPGNQAVQRQVVAERAQGSYWVVTQGLAAGEKVIVQGTANLRANAPIRAVPMTTPQRLRAPAPDADGGDGASEKKGG